MSLIHYKQGLQLELIVEQKGISFYSIIHVAMRKADSYNLDRLKEAFPAVWDDFEKRYNTPGGLLPGDK